MGCLCSSSHQPTTKILTRSVTACTNRELNFSFDSLMSQRGFFSEYVLGKDPIGSGLFGEIRLCTQISTSKIFAVKIISKAGLPTGYKRTRVVELQIKILKKIDHPSILKLQDSFEDASNYYLVMEYIKGGDLYSAIERRHKFSEDMAAKVIKQLLSAIAYLHKMKIAHRDIKPENLLIEEKDDEIIVKLIDFDTAFRFEDNKPMKGTYGTVYYMAPELINGEYSEKCDVWSAGIILYTLITNNFPFGGNTDEDIMRNIKNCRLNTRVLLANKASPELIHLIKKLLHPNPKKRISASDATSHFWLQKHAGFCENTPPIMTHKPDFRCFLAQALRHWVVKYLVPSNETVSCHLTFLNLDKNFDGVISKEELIEEFGKSDNLEIIMEIADLNANGVLEYDEFLSIMMKKEKLKKYAEELFNSVDSNNTGKVTLEDLSRFLNSYLEENQLMNNLDSALCGDITRESFAELMDFC